MVKLPSLQYAAVPEKEFVMLNLPADVADFPGMALAIERFGRGDGERRIHMEDFAQVFGLFPEDKYGKRGYANIAAVLEFSVRIGNGNLHLKNWSLLYPDGRTPVLSPITSACHSAERRIWMALRSIGSAG